MDISKYTITNIRRGKNERQHIIYAELRDEQGELVIAATLDYIHDRIRELTKTGEWVKREDGNRWTLKPINQPFVA